jgi:ComF family protein
LRETILAMKQRRGELLAECLGRLWARHHAERFRALGVDLVIPVPLHWWRQLRRGYNQSESLSAAIARRLQIDHRPGWLKRIRPTQYQTALPAAARRENVRGAFRVARSAVLAGRRVLLIDDVLTTGSTLHEAARALGAKGAHIVHAAVASHR